MSATSHAFEQVCRSRLRQKAGNIVRDGSQRQELDTFLAEWTMRFLHRRAFSDSKVDGKMIPIWPRSPKSPKTPTSPGVPKSPKSPKHSTYTRRNKDGLNQCMACDDVDDMIRMNMEQQRLGNGSRRLRASLHSTFAELDECAATCHSCRVFRQALLLDEVTFDGLAAIRETRNEVDIDWKENILVEGSVNNSLAVVIDDATKHSGPVTCSVQNEIAHLALHPDALSDFVIQRAKGWLRNCLDNHVGECDNLRFNGDPPQLLIEIHSPNLIQLRKNHPVDYVALSYCWGQENNETRKGKTVTRNVEDRCKEAFSTKGLPTTVRDAISIVYAMGYRYIWVDYLCIDQHTFAGGHKMHIVYSNALFTLCACATTAATQGLLDHRSAWTQRTEACRLGGLWLTTPDMSLNELRSRSPLAARAWTLQEERLSSRVLYVSSSRMYWSCAMGCQMELEPAVQEKTTTLQRPVYSATDRHREVPPSQNFLMACRAGEDDLYPFWADIVRSYALRDLGQREDRLKALAGLAARYLDATSHDKYLAGMWADNLAVGLAWKVEKSVTKAHLAEDPGALEYPSWTWAGLPKQTPIETDGYSSPPCMFSWIPDEYARSPDAKLDVGCAIERGEEVKRLCVTGRTRALWQSSSRRVDWSTISKHVKGEERFTFSANPGQDMHATDPGSGRIVVYEVRKKEVVGQLDFERDILRVQSGQVELLALEIGETTMLLLEQRKDGAYRRQGVAWNVRRDFFARVAEQDRDVLIVV